MKTNFVPSCLQDEIAGVLIDCYLARSREIQRNRLRIRSRPHDEVVLQLALVAVINQIHAGINVLIVYFAVGGDVGLPALGIAATKIVGLAWHFVHAGDRCLPVRTQQLHTKGCAIVISNCVV